MSQKSEKGEKKENSVSVAVRIRPRNDKEIQADMPVAFSPSEDNRDVQELNEDGDIVKRWSYDNVFGPDNNNKFIFDTMGAKLVDAALDGYNSVLFMYGQTSSGKTFTLFGGGSTAGVIQHCMEYLHAKVMGSVDSEYVIRLTYAELYNEELKDLLAPNASPEGLKIIDDPLLGPLIQNITEVNFTSAAEVKQLLDEGENRRHFGVTNMNAHSSRSHVLVRLSIETRKVPTKSATPLRLNWGKDKPNVVSTLNLVDLAGSERAGKSGTSGQALKEGNFINKSLLTLGTVISNLSEGKLGAHIPYRDSKLTRLLSSALGGNAKTSMITCISPASGNISESLSTLRFASRAKRIVNQVSRNEILSVKALSQKLAVANSELDTMRAQLELSRQMGFVVDEDGVQGETIKDKAVNVSRNMRNLRFLMTNTPKLVAGLRKVGMNHLVKKVQHDLKEAIAGSRDLSEIIEEHTVLINTYLANDRKLVAKVTYLAEENESDRMYGEGDMDNELEGSDGGEDALNMDAEELREEMEGANLYAEDVRAVAVQHIDQLHAALVEMTKNERAAAQRNVELQDAIIEHEKNIKRHQTTELNLQNTIAKLQEEQQDSHKGNQTKTKKINALEAQISENEATISAKDHEIVLRDAEIARFRTAVEQVENEMQTANAQKKLLEEEFSRQRNDMRQQMEKMRGNMHTMLQHGGDQVKVLETQLELMQKELESVKDYLEEESRSKERLELEMSHLRRNIAVLQDEQRVHISELNICRKQNAELTQKIKDSRWKLIKVSSSLSVSEDHNSKMHRKFDEDLAAKEERMAVMQAEMRAQQDQIEARCKAAIIQQDKMQLELTAAYEQIEHKAATITRLEQTLSADTARLEKKLHAQSKHNEELAVDLTNVNAHTHVLTNKHIEETKALKHKIAELQAVVDAVNQRIEEEVAEIDAVRAEEESASNSPGTPYSPYYRDSILDDSSRRNSYSADSPMLRSVSFILGPRRNTGNSPRSDAALSPVRGGPASPQQLTWNIDGATEVDEDATETKGDQSPVQAGRSTPNLTPMKSALKGKSASKPLTVETTAPKEAWEPPQESSAQFQRICAGMQLLTTLMTHSMSEERILRNFVVNHHAQLLDQTGADREKIQHLADKQEYLEEKASAQQDSLEFSKDTERKASDRMAQAEAEYLQMRAQYLQSVRNEQGAMGTAAKFEQMYLDLRLQLDKVRKEKKQYMDSGLDSTVKFLELEAKFEEQQEALSVLRSKLELSEQELGVVKVERDELMKRFLRNGTYANSTGHSNGSAGAAAAQEASSSPTPGVARAPSLLRSASGSMSSSMTATGGNGRSVAAATTPGRPSYAPSSPVPPPAQSPLQSPSYAQRSAFPESSLLSPGASAQSTLYSRSALTAAAASTSSPLPPPPQQRTYAENTYGRYSTLTPQDRQPSEAFISLFGSHSKSASRGEV